MAVEPRIGAMSVDHNKTLYGIPDYGIPVPLAGPLKTPEIAFYKRETQQGVIKLAVTSYNPKTGALIQSVDPVYGYAHTTERAVLIFFYWTRNDLMPEIGRASCRERVCKYVSIPGAAVSLKKKQK